MWSLKLCQQLFEIAGCIVRQNAYFIHTHHYVPSVLIVTRSKQHLIRPLIKQLTIKNDYYLPQELQKFKLNLASQENLHVQATEVTQSGIYGLKFNEQSEFLVGQLGSETLELKKEVKKEDQVYGVVLFKGVSDQKVKFMFGNLLQLNFFCLKLFVVVKCWKLCRSVLLQSRYENHHLVKENK